MLNDDDSAHQLVLFAKLVNAMGWAEPVGTTRRRRKEEVPGAAPCDTIGATDHLVMFSSGHG